jgi:hypothetical protein
LLTLILQLRFALRGFLLFVLAKECEMLREVKRSEAAMGKEAGERLLEV